MSHAETPLPAFSPEQLASIPAVLSIARFETYLAAASRDASKALRLYTWNSKVSAAFFSPFHLVEISVRNAVSDAIESAYGTVDWHMSQTFAADLKNPVRGYSPRRDLDDAKAGALRNLSTAEDRRRTLAARQARTQPFSQPLCALVPVGKVIAELKFVFWISMLTASHQTKIWDDNLSRAFPNLPGSNGSITQVEAAQANLHRKMNDIRRFRNRVAHHEPLLRFDLKNELRRIIEVVGWRCRVTAEWLQHEQDVSRLIDERPR